MCFSKTLVFFFLFLLTDISLSQELKNTFIDEAKKPDILGLQFGISNTYNSKVLDHGVYNVFVEHPINEKLSVKAQFEYFEKDFSYPGYYYDKAYPGQTLMKYWRNISLNIGLLASVTKHGVIGGGFSLDYCDINRSIFSQRMGMIYDDDHQIQRMAMIYDWNHQVLGLVRPGIFGLAGLNFKLNDYFTFFLEGQYKMVFIGKEFGSSPLSTTNSMTAYMGIKFDVGK